MISPIVLRPPVPRPLSSHWVAAAASAVHSTFYQKWLTLARMGKGCLGLAIALAVLGCDAERPMTVGEYCRRVSDQLHRCFKEYQEILAAPRPGYPACDAYGRDIEAQFQILVERPMSPEARRVAGYVHMKAIDFVDHVFPHEPGDSEHYTERNTAALSALAAICDGMPDSLE